MNRRQALARARQYLAAADPQATPLEAEVLLRHILGVGRAELFRDFQQEISPEIESAFLALVDRRRLGEPIAYLIGHREFYGLDFFVDQRVLIPRPESESLVEQALRIVAEHPVRTVADIGTGSGAIAVCLARQLPEVKIFATDISPAALEVARQNAARHEVAGRIIFLEGDLLDPLPEMVDIIIINPPYIAAASLTGPVGFEPATALDGGPDGLDVIRRLCRRLPARLAAEGHLIMEIGYDQAAAVTGLLKEVFPRSYIEVIPDLAGLDRVVCLSPVAAVRHGGSRQ
jgi:release factor glutamine methyltransferase